MNSFPYQSRFVFIFLWELYLENHSKIIQVPALDLLVAGNLQQGMNENKDSVNLSYCSPERKYLVVNQSNKLAVYAIMYNLFRVVLLSCAFLFFMRKIHPHMFNSCGCLAHKENQQRPNEIKSAKIEEFGLVCLQSKQCDQHD